MVPNIRGYFAEFEWGMVVKEVGIPRGTRHWACCSRGGRWVGCNDVTSGSCRVLLVVGEEFYWGGVGVVTSLSYLNCPPST